MFYLFNFKSTKLPNTFNSQPLTVLMLIIIDMVVSMYTIYCHDIVQHMSTSYTSWHNGTAVLYSECTYKCLLAWLSAFPSTASSVFLLCKADKWGFLICISIPYTITTVPTCLLVGMIIGEVDRVVKMSKRKGFLKIFRTTSTILTLFKNKLLNQIKSPTELFQTKVHF